MNHKNNPGLDEASNDYQRFLADLRGEILSQVRHGRTWKDIAVKAYVGTATVQRFADGTTMRPTSFTVNQLALSAGYRVAIVPVNTPRLPGEIG